MIAVCPKCSARYRVDSARLGPEGAKLRCTKCSALFLVRVPNAPSQPAAVTPAFAAGALPVPAVRAAQTPSPIQTPMPSPADSGWIVLVADPEEARGKASAEVIRSWGVKAHLVHDGVEAMLAIQRLMPQVVVLDAALPRMYGFQVCEIVKRNPSLKHMTVVLVGAVHDPNRYRRDPSDLYGADMYLEPPDLPDGLRPLLGPSGNAPVRAPEPIAAIARTPSLPERPIAPPVRATPIPPASMPASNQTVVAAPAAAPVPVASADPARDEERERARRLARIAVSEMLLYQPDKFAQAAREGTLERVLDLEIQEARALLRQRIGPEVRAEGDFVLEELHRVARERVGKA